MSEFGKSEYGERLDYAHNKCQDVLFAILFYLHIAGVAIGCAWLFIVEIPEMNNAAPPGQQTNVPLELTGVWVTIPICSLAGLLIGIIFLQIIKAFPTDAIKVLYFSSIVCWSILFLVGIVVLNIGMIVVGGLMTFITSVYVWYIWDLIPFSSTLLVMSAKIVNIYGDIVWISILGIVFQLCFLFLWSAMAGAYLFTKWKDEEGDPINAGLIFLMLLSLYWGLMVFNNVVRVSSCCSASIWYYSASVEQKPTTPSLRLTLLTSFGSLCFGSMFASILEGIRVIVTTLTRHLEDGESGCECCCNGIIYLMESMIRYFNTYSWAHVAIYAKGYIQCSKETWSLFKHSNIMPIIKQDLTGTATFCGSIASALINASIGYLLGWLFYRDAEKEQIRHIFPSGLAIYGGISGLVFTANVLTIIRGAVVTIFVCFAEDGLLMQENRPLYYQKLIKAEPRFINVTKHVANGVPTETETLTQTQQM